MAKINYQNKVALNTLPGIPNENKVMDIDMNEIKTSVNWLYDNLGVVSLAGNLVNNSDPENPVIDMAVSSDAGNNAILGSDGLVYVKTEIEVGVTDSDGTDQCVLFQSGGKVQQSNLFKFDPVTGRFNINNVASPTAQINAKATSALSSDYFFRLRNAADSFDMLRFDNNGGARIQTPSSIAYWDFSNSSGQSVAQIGVANNVGSLKIGSNGNIAQFGAYGSTDTRELSAGVYGKGKFGIGANPFGGTSTLPNEASTNIAFFNTGVNPALNFTTGYQQYSANNGTFHYPAFRLSDGKVVKLEPQDSTSIATLTDLINALKNAGILY
jgi:hypothetical protein